MQKTNAFGEKPTKLLLILGLILLLGAEGYFGYQLHRLSNQQKELKEDYANVNDITFGLFSVQQWRSKVSGIIHRHVRNFKLTSKQKKALQTEVEQILIALIDKAEILLNKPKKTLDGKIKKFIIKTFVKTDSIREKVPGLAKEILAKIDNPDNKKQLSSMAMSKFDSLERAEYLDSTILATRIATEKVYQKYQVSSVGELNKKLISKLSDIKSATYNYSFAMLACIAIVLSLWWIFRKKTELHTALFIMSLMFAFMLLFIGLTAAMIEVDARINAFDFIILGEHVVFENQVLFFQSKSILDVVSVLLKQPAADSVLVGVLILVFSILFPVMKLSATGIHLLSKKQIAENSIIKYFAFQSGKWSMADVIVIAIFMVYIGLNGLLERQLRGLNLKSEDLTVITTHNTSLQPGFIIFISFVLYGLMLSTILKYISPHDCD